MLFPWLIACGNVWNDGKKGCLQLVVYVIYWAVRGWTFTSIRQARRYDQIKCADVKTGGTRHSFPPTNIYIYIYAVLHSSAYALVLYPLSPVADFTVCSLCRLTTPGRHYPPFGMMIISPRRSEGFRRLIGQRLQGTSASKHPGVKGPEQKNQTHYLLLLPHLLYAIYCHRRYSMSHGVVCHSPSTLSTTRVNIR